MGILDAHAEIFLRSSSVSARLLIVVAETAIRRYETGAVEIEISFHFVLVPRQHVVAHHLPLLKIASTMETIGVVRAARPIVVQTTSCVKIATLLCAGLAGGSLPEGLAVAPNGDVYVATFDGSKKNFVFNENGGLLQTQTGQRLEVPSGEFRLDCRVF